MIARRAIRGELGLSGKRPAPRTLRTLLHSSGALATPPLSPLSIDVYLAVEDWADTRWAIFRS